MDRVEARKIICETPTSVYPVGSNKPVAVVNSMVSLTGSGIRLRVINFQSPTSISQKSGKPMIIVGCVPITCLTGYSLGSKVLGIAVKAVCRDSQGEYVWKGIDVQELLPGKGLKHIFNIKKVYVKLDDVVNKVAGYASIQKFEPNEQLKFGDIILINTPKDIKEGDEVSISQKRYIFMPSDPVKVVIGK